MKTIANNLDDFVIFSETFTWGKKTSGGYIPDAVAQKAKELIAGQKNNLKKLGKAIDELQEVAPPLYEIRAFFEDQSIMLVKRDEYDKTKINTARLLYFRLA